MKKSPKGFKRWLLAMMVLAVPMVSGQPISLLQESPYVPKISAPRIPFASHPKPVRYGTASWYSETDPGINLHTANGEIFDDSKLTCASWEFPFGTLLKVTNQGNGKSVVCRVNDRGPHKRLKRAIDLTKTAFSKINNPRQGLIRVAITPIKKS